MVTFFVALGVSLATIFIAYGLMANIMEVVYYSKAASWEETSSRLFKSLLLGLTLALLAHLALLPALACCAITSLTYFFYYRKHYQEEVSHEASSRSLN